MSGIQAVAPVGAAKREDPRLSPGFGIGIGFTLTLAAAAVLSELRPDSYAGLVVMAVICAVCGWSTRISGVAVTAGISWLMLDGFVVGHEGQLSWHGTSDVVRLAVLFACALAVSAIRAGQLRVRRHRDARAVLDRLLAEPRLPLSGLRGGRHA